MEQVRQWLLNGVRQWLIMESISQTDRVMDAKVVVTNEGMVKAITFFDKSIKATADALGVKPPTVCQWRAGKRPVPPRRCVELEQLTGGVISRKELRADWAGIWPELNDVEGK